jgi:hypothetical protein
MLYEDIQKLISGVWNFVSTNVWIALNVTEQKQFQNTNKKEIISAKMTNSVWGRERKQTDDM